MVNNRKGLRDIRTPSSILNQAECAPYKAYMKLCCLEMEKSRREKEKESALHRLKTINARFNEIESEKEAIFKALNKRASDKADHNHRMNLKPAYLLNVDSFKIKY